jgi:hypothetical protein
VRSVGVVGRVLCACVIEYHTEGECGLVRSISVVIRYTQKAGNRCTRYSYNSGNRLKLKIYSGNPKSIPPKKQRSCSALGTVAGGGPESLM